MSWDWNYQAGPVGSLEDLSDYCDSVRVIAEQAVGKRGTNPVVEYRHGEVSSPRKNLRAAHFILETVLKYTDSAGDVTHTDGAAGHVMENLGHLKRIFGGLQGQLVRLQRDAPDQGTVYRDVEVMEDATPSQARHIYTWALKAPWPFWIGAADTGNATPTWTNGGDAPAGSLVIDITGTTTDPRVTLDSTSDYIEYNGVLPAGGVRIDVDAGTCVRITGGADESNNLVVSAPWWMELDPGANAVTVSQASGTPTITADWVEQWR